MAATRIERILVLAKTYPSPSAQYVETSCVAGISETGAMRRLYPVPFRMIEEGQQFKKWQWISVRVEKANKDHRLESHKVYVDSIKCENFIDSSRGWVMRWEWLDKMPCFTSLDDLNAARESEGVSIALLRPKKVLGLEISKARHDDWTDEEREKLMREQMQGSLFDEAEAKSQVKELRKIPFDFYYRCVWDSANGEFEKKLKIVDWEAGALYWRCCKSHGAAWEKPFRAKLENDLQSKDLMFLLGNQHRFQDQWLIISLIYPPMREPQDDRQSALF
ncbi:MAG: hypothetical protein RLZ36_44 [Pseudomonadota bacterium]|jgi:hypothetical protein